jgi:hypothetical protein
MAKKTLNEAVVRRFQKLANVAPINEMYSKNEEYLNEEEEGAEELAPPEDAGMGDMEADAEEPADMEGDLELTDEEAQAIIDLGSKLEAAMGDMGDMDDMGGEEMPADDMGGEEEMGEEDIMEALRGINYTPSRTEVVNEVAKRVAKRLQTAKLHEAKLKRALGRK